MACKLPSLSLKYEEMTEKLFMLFSLDDSRFAVSTEMIKEVMPLSTLTTVPKTEPYIAGLIHYNGKSIPVIDSVMLLYKKPHKRKICTRIIILNYKHSDVIPHVGLIVESANKTIKYDADNIDEHNLTKQHTSYLGKIINVNNEEIQLIDVDALIPQEAAHLQSAASCS